MQHRTLATACIKQQLNSQWLTHIHGENSKTLQQPACSQHICLQPLLWYSHAACVGCSMSAITCYRHHERSTEHVAELQSSACMASKQLVSYMRCCSGGLQNLQSFVSTTTKYEEMGQCGFTTNCAACVQAEQALPICSHGCCRFICCQARFPAVKARIVWVVLTCSQRQVGLQCGGSS
jgi:hypothetical protein